MTVNITFWNDTVTESKNARAGIFMQIFPTGLLLHDEGRGQVQALIPRKQDGPDRAAVGKRDSEAYYTLMQVKSRVWESAEEENAGS